MRLLHTSDWHLGRSLHGEVLVDAQRQVLERIVEVVDEHAVDAVLVSGDVFDRAMPPVDAVRLLGDTLAALATRVPTVVISGNHDSAERLGFGAPLFRPGMHVCTAASQVGQPVELADEHGPVLVYPIPYLDPDLARVALAPDAGQPLDRSHEAVLQAAMQRVRDDLTRRQAATPGVRSVVLAHAFVAGGLRPSTTSREALDAASSTTAQDRSSLRSDSERDLRVGGTEVVPAEVFAGVDYVALGHLHGAQEPQAVGRTRLRYSGSPLRYSFSEALQDKSVTLVDLDAEGVREVSAVPLAQPRGMAVVTGSFDDVIGSDRFAGHVDDWVQVTVTDPARPHDLVAAVRGRFPHALVVRHEPTSGALLERGHLTQVTSLDPLVVAQSFVHYVTGADATDAEVAAFASAYEAVVAAERSA